MNVLSIDPARLAALLDDIPTEELAEMGADIADALGNLRHLHNAITAQVRQRLPEGGRIIPGPVADILTEPAPTYNWDAPALREALRECGITQDVVDELVELVPPEPRYTVDTRRVNGWARKLGDEAAARIMAHAHVEYGPQRITFARKGGTP